MSLRWRVIHWGNSFWCWLAYVDGAWRSPEYREIPEYILRTGTFVKSPFSKEEAPLDENL
jgi:hypothetical protein